jgi:mannitol-specific phosphotransferase system IIBC component
MARLKDPPPTPPRSPFLAPPPRPQLPPASPALKQRGWAALTLPVLSLLAMTAIGNIQRGIYVVAVALAVASAGLILAFTTISASRRAGTRRPRGVMAGAVLSVIAFVLCSFVLAGFLIFWTQLHQYANCMDAANTTTTQTACQNQLNNSVSNEISDLGGG